MREPLCEKLISWSSRRNYEEGIGMRILVLASIPFDGMRRRQQQVALGLAERGHDVFYLDPPRPFRSLIHRRGLELEEIPIEDEGEDAAVDAGADPAASDAEEVGGISVRTVRPQLRVGEKGVAMAAMGRWGWATRVGWKHWSDEVRDVMRALPADVSFAPEIVLVYHPALIPAVRETFDGLIAFDCLDDFPSLARSRSIATAYEDVLNAGVPLVDGMTAPNRYILESWERLLRPGVPQAVIEHGVDLALFRPAEPTRTAATRKALDIPADAKMVCYLGRTDARISYEDVQTMLELEKDALFAFVGEVAPEGRAILQRLPSNRILPVGPLRPEQAADVVAAADALIFPFRREPHLEQIRGLKLYEYLATGRPIVASFRRALKAYRELLYLYATREELDAGFRAALAEPEDAQARGQRIEVAQEAAWEKRVVEMEGFLRQMG